MARALQAQGILFQLLAIAEQNAAMRRRRHIERTRGRAALRGTFDHVLAEAASEGIAPEEIQTLLSGLRIRPVITAHPTESKRVTVLEKYRKIYLLLRELEQPRWTERERTALIGDLRDQIELVWMTGELHLEKPTVQHEVSRGLHFFDEALFDKAPEMLGADRRARSSTITRGRISSCPRSSSSARGSAATATAIRRSPPTSPAGRCARTRSPRCATTATRITELARALSITERALPVPPDFQAELARALGGSGEADAITKRNPGEPYRQYLSIVLRKLDATIARVQGMDIGGPGAPYLSADELIQDLRVIEQALQQANSPSIAADLVKPVRRAVEIFRFSTVRLDLRENTTKTTAALQALWWATAGHGDDSPPELGSREWRAWLFRALARPLTGPHLIPELAAEATELIDMFAQAAETRREVDRDAFGSFILSMTRSVDDILGAYLLAKEGGAFLDAAGTEICALPIVPLFETIGDLARRAHHHARGAQRAADPPLHPLAGQRAGGDDRLFRFQQGRRLRRLQLGAGQGAVAADQGRRRDGHGHRLLSRPRRLGVARRRADRARHRRPAGRLDPRPLPRHRAGRGGVL